VCLETAEAAEDEDQPSNATPAGASVISSQLQGQDKTLRWITHHHVALFVCLQLLRQAHTRGAMAT
jgi:hypothetical protein